MKKICKILLVLMILVLPIMSGCKTNEEPRNWRECYAVNIITSNSEKSYNNFFREFNKENDYIVRDDNYEKVYVKFEKDYIFVKCITFNDREIEFEYFKNNCIYQVRWK